MSQRCQEDVPPQDGDTVITRLSWADRMEFEDRVNDKLETMLQPMENFVHEVFNPVTNTS